MAAHPTIVFRVKLDPFMTETTGPLTNTKTIAPLPSERYQSDNDQAITDLANRKTVRSTWLPGRLGASNIKLKNDNTFTLVGEDAVYVKNNYATGSEAYLDIVSES